MGVGSVLFAISTLIGIFTAIGNEVGNYNARLALDSDTKALKRLQRAVSDGTADIDYIRLNLNNLRQSLMGYAHILSPNQLQKINKQLDRAEFSTTNYRNSVQNELNTNTVGNYTGSFADLFTSHKGKSGSIDKATEKVEKSGEYLRKELADLGIHDDVNIPKTNNINNINNNSKGDY